MHAFEYKLNLHSGFLYYKKTGEHCNRSKNRFDAANYIKDRHPEDAQIMKDAFKYFYNGVNFFSVSYLNAE